MRDTADIAPAATAPAVAAPARSLVLATMCVGVLVAQLDTSVVNLAVKQIGADLRIGVSALQWVLDAYNLVYATLLLTGGTLADLYGRRRVFVAGVLVFTTGSLLCALAPGGAALIAGRAATGLGAALILPASLAILAVTYPDPRERGRALGIWASCNGLAMAIGPTAGGVLVDAFGWRSIFFVIIPASVLALVMALRSVPESADPAGRRLDPLGQALAILALGMLALVAIEAPHGGWTSPAILACLAVAIAAAALFLRVEAGKPGALVPLALFRGRDFSAAMAITALMTFGMYGLLFLMPLYLQAVRGASAFVAGVELLPMSLTFVVVSQCSGMLARRLGARLMMVLGMGLMGAGLLLLAPIGEGTGLVAIELAFFIIGVGLGLNTGPVLGVAVASVPPARSGTASGLANTARMVGATLGVAILGALFALHAGEAAASGVAASAGSGAILAGLRLAFLGGGAAELLGGAIAFVVRPDALEHHAA